jgi:hypothetical protein
MKIFTLPWLLIICVLGLVSSQVRWRSLDRWCARQLTDSDVPEADL